MSSARTKRDHLCPATKFSPMLPKLATAVSSSRESLKDEVWVCRCTLRHPHTQPPTHDQRASQPDREGIILPARREEAVRARGDGGRISTNRSAGAEPQG